MSWTVIDADTSWQDLEIAQEIATAYNKRVAVYNAFSPSESVSTITPGVTMTVREFVSAVQNGINLMSTRWSDPDLTLSNTLDAIPWGHADADAFYTGAGLTGSGGFRRIPEGGSAPADWTVYDDAGWSYGPIAAKDLAGPWLWQDLQTALSHMTRFVTGTNGTGGQSATASASGTLSPASIPAISGAPSYSSDNAAYGFMFSFSRSANAASNTLVESGGSHYCSSYPVSGATAELKNVVTYQRAEEGYDGANFYDFGWGMVAQKYNKRWYWDNTADAAFSPGDGDLYDWSWGPTALTDWTTLIAAAPSSSVKSMHLSLVLWYVFDYQFDP